MSKHPMMTIQMASKNKIEIELYPEIAPNSVNGLIWLLNKNGFDNMTIARIVPDFVLQPWYDENIMPLDYQYLINGEFASNGYEKNNLPMDHYTVALAGDGQHFSSPGCFFIVVGDHCQKRLEGKFAAIGKVVSGFAEVDRIVSVPLRKVDIDVPGVSVNVPIEDEIILHIDLALNGYEPALPDQFLPETLKK